MRNRIRKQLRLVEPSIDHEHAKELHAIRTLIVEHPETIDLIYEDLIRGLSDPDAGRDGMMTAEQVFKVLLICPVPRKSPRMIPSENTGKICETGVEAVSHVVGSRTP